MARLMLKFDEQILRETDIGGTATIGRLPDNSVVVDNPAVSSHHARIIREGGDFIVEDLNSTNGTFVNEKRVSRHTLRSGDVLLVGKHHIVFDGRRGHESEAPTQTDLTLEAIDSTMFLDTKRHRELIAKLQSGQGATNQSAGASGSLALGVLHVISGRADQDEYPLEARTSLIGRDKASAVRLKGWFKPKVAVAIARNREGYVATLLAGKTTINSEPGSGRYDLKDGDILGVSGLTLEFRLRQPAQLSR